LSEQASRLHRVLGLSDLSFFLIAALVNLNSVPVVAGSGPGALLFWVIGFVLFFIPQSIAVLELSARYPQEGGIYNWSKIAFGNFHGFISGWSYWVNNIFYVPTLLFYIVGFSAYIGGAATAGVSEDPLFMVCLSLVLLWIITSLNIRGLGVGKWIQTLGATGTFLTTVIILGIGVASIQIRGMANPVTTDTLTAPFGDWRSLALLSVVCLNYTGLELGSVMGDEIKRPLWTIPRAAIIAGVTTFILYVVATFALQATIPAGQIGVIDGILQGVEHAATSVHMPWLVVPIAVLLSLNAAGNTSAWLAGSARIPFVIGLDRYLPAALGRIHPRYSTPHVALVVQGLASSLFIVISAIGSSVHDMYLVLLQTTVVLQLIPYLYMFAALVWIRTSPERFGNATGFFQSTPVLVVAGVLGFAVTLGGILLAVVPSNAVDDVWNFEAKTFLGIVSFMVPAVLLFRWKMRTFRGAGILPRELEAVPREVEVAPDR
jgi:glutamate:GABA antiporter